MNARVQTGSGRLSAAVREIVATNDVHSHILANSSLFELIGRLRSQGALVVDSGDFFAGGLEFEVFGGKLETSVLDTVYDVIGPGNHGFHIYEKMAKGGGGPKVVCSNLRGWPGPQFYIHEEMRLLVGAIIGAQAYAAVDPPHPAYDFQEPRKVVSDLCVLAANRRLELLLLSHQGFDQDCILVRGLAHPSPLVAVVAGHCHGSGKHAVIGEIPIVMSPENGLEARIVTLGDQETSVNSLVVTPNNIRSLDQSKLGNFLESARSELAAATDAPRTLLLGPRAALIRSRTQLVECMAEFGSLHFAAPVLLNIYAIRTLVAGVDRSFSEIDVKRLVPFGGQLHRCTLSAAVEEVVVALGEQGEYCTFSSLGAAGESTIITTEFLAKYLQNIKLCEASDRIDTSLRELATLFLQGW